MSLFVVIHHMVSLLWLDMLNLETYLGFSAWGRCRVINCGKGCSQSCSRIPQQSCYRDGIFDTGKRTITMFA